MQIHILLPLFTFLVFVSTTSMKNDEIIDYKPTQIHLSFGNSVSDIVVTWVTASSTMKSIVQYGVNGLISRVEGREIKFKHTKTRISYIHKTILQNLEPNTTYEYNCGCDYGWSDLLHFKTLPNDSNWSPTFGIFGDMGVENAQILPYVVKDVKAEMYDAVFHVGDMAYNMEDNEGRVGDAFLQEIEPIAANVPYMTAVGNHEQFRNFTGYRYRFTMPGDTQGLYYSINIGPVHFIIITTEVYYFFEYYKEFGIKNQLQWLVNDLKEASSPENRTQYPWIVTMGHRPMYCSILEEEECKSENDAVRLGLEDVFYKYGVDIEIWGHEHNYERSWPLYNYKIYNGSNKNPFHNPRAPIHVTTGAAGSKEFIDYFEPKPRNWTAFRSADYSYTRMKVFNKTHIFFEQISVNKTGKPIDNFWVVKDSNSTYPKRPIIDKGRVVKQRANTLLKDQAKSLC